MSDPICAVALDVGGSSIKIGAVDVDAHCSRAPSLPIDHEASVEVLLDHFAEAFVMGQSLAPHPTAHLGMAFPAPFDYQAGVAEMTHKFVSLYQRPLRSAIIERVGEPLEIRFVNDAAAAGIGEFHSSAEHVGRMLFITLGTGFGSTLIDNGQVASEHHVGELWQRSTPGGTADDVFSARGLAARLGTDMDGLPAYLDQPGNETSNDLLKEFGSELGAFLASVVLTTDADRVVIGGGLSAAFARFANPLQGALSVPVSVSNLQNGAGVLGAGMHALSQGLA